MIYINIHTHYCLLNNWGHAFHPDYKVLGCLKQNFPNVPVMEFTATKTAWKVSMRSIQKLIYNVFRCDVL